MPRMNTMTARTAGSIEAVKHASAAGAGMTGGARHGATVHLPVGAQAPVLSADEWFASGARLVYDPRGGKFRARSGADTVQVFRQIVAAPSAGNTRWISFLPGWPDGSYGWARVDQILQGRTGASRLFVEYVGHGDSDKPLDYPYGTVERADLVEALWQAEGVRSTFIVTFDYSSIVTLELLNRQEERRRAGIEPVTRIEGVLLINGGLFADAHSHPWFTTPVLKSPLGRLVTWLAQRSKFAFRELMKPLWSKDYAVTETELRDLRGAIARRNGVVALSRSAGFVGEHRRNAGRWDLGRIYHALRDRVSFHVVGSEEDPFEWRQAAAARERLGASGLDVRIVPGGHLTTSEQPELLARIIGEVVPV